MTSQVDITWVTLGLFLAAPRAARPRFSAVPCFFGGVCVGFFSPPSLVFVVFAPDPCHSSGKQEGVYSGFRAPHPPTLVSCVSSCQISEIPVPLPWCWCSPDLGGPLRSPSSAF